jgi:chromosome segregation protein
MEDTQMRLEKIVVHGFKSFADKTEFGFNQQITGIVGPNGCGKSNVVDAVKWVLGEQSAKSLRSGNMADLIFSGSSSRKASGMAEVMLTFSGVAVALGTEQDELQIGRRLYRSGDSEYTMNGKVCRLKDIKETFMDTGVGMKAYSIIEQGQIDQLLHASKVDRRVIFEEAAGISRYKAHKKEALRKLERTEQNLLRLADIVAEVQRQLRSVKLQAGKARNFLEYNERLKELRLKYSLSEYHKMYVQTAEKKSSLAGFEEKFGAAVAAVGRNEALVSQLANEVTDTEGLIRGADNALVSARSRIEQNLERIKYLQARADELAQRKEAASGQIVKLTDQAEKLKVEMTSAQDELGRCEGEYEAKSEAVRQAESAIHAINMECSSIEADLDDEKSGIIDIVRRTAQLHNQIQSMSTFRDNLAGQKERLAGRVNEAQTQLEGLLREKAGYQARMGDVDKVIADLQKSLEEKREEMGRVSDELTAEAESLGKSREARSGLQSELAVLKDMERKQEGVKGAVRKLFEAKQKNSGDYAYIEAIVADAISAQPEYAKAVEGALEGRTDAVLVRSTEALLVDSARLASLDGRVGFISMDEPAAAAETLDVKGIEGARGWLADFVAVKEQYAAAMSRLLAGTVVVDTLSHAAAAAKTVGGGYRFVTMDGQTVSADGVISTGAVGKSSGLISRRSRLAELEKELERVNAEIAGKQEQMERHDQQNKHLARLCQDLRTSVYEANTEKTELLSRLRMCDQQVARLEHEQPLIKGEIETLERQIAESVGKEYESKQKLDELEVINAQRSVRIAELEGRAKEYQQRRNAEAAALTDLRVAMGRIGEQRKGLTGIMASLGGQLQQTQMALGAARADVSGCGEQIEQTQRNILTCESAVAELFVEKEHSQEESRRLHELIEELFTKRTEAEDALKKARAQQSDVESRISEVKIELSQLEVRQTDLVERVREELLIDVAAVYKEYKEEETDWEAVRAEIADLRGRIERLGSVNVDAIQEQEELEKRNEFLTAQVDDLQKSKSQLEQLIAKINKESREKFRETFDKVRVNFQELFRKLFGGGRADIVLDDPEDILESGIEIVARPPGKETRSISLLSGGEKTMTAIALLFAVFKIKPSPFCFLDEVDAALDEANNERFNIIVKEFKEGSQFVVITHSKRTMSMADVLYGVTMQTQGVSKKISVKFDEYDVDDEPAAVA